MLITLFAAALLASPPIAPPDLSQTINVRVEPHHHQVLENAHVRAFRVSIPAGEATIVHQHDLPYLYFMLAPGTFSNDVTGKPEVHVVMTNGQAAYSKGGFSHLVRPDAGTSFNNVTVELLDPPGEVHNLCQKVVADAPLDCPAATEGGRSALWETGAIRVTSVTLAPKTSDPQSGPLPARLLIANSDLTVAVHGQPKKVVHAGEVLWLEAGNDATAVTPDGKAAARFLEVRFKGTEPAAKP